MKNTTILLMAVMLAIWCAGVRGTYAMGSGALDSESGWYPAGTNLLVTAMPETYSRLDRWEGDTAGIADVSVETIECSVDGSKTLTAVFVDQVTETNAVPHRWLADMHPDWTNDFESAATNDWDDDGFTTAQEYWSGTSPTNEMSFLHIASVHIVDGQVQLNWEHAQVYADLPPLAIQRRDSLSDGGWEQAAQYSAQDGMNTWSNTAVSPAFYRLAVTNAPFAQ